MSEEIDGYWLRMGHIGVDALVNGGLVANSLSPEQISAAAEWLGFLLDSAYNMGIRLGKAQGEYVARMREIRQ